MSAVDLLVPGDLGALTGGYIYDRRILEGLSALGWDARAHALDASFPRPSTAALADAARLLDSLDSCRLVVIDGLALAGLLPLLGDARKRLALVALIHHPLAYETGLEPGEAAALARLERDALAEVARVIVTSPWTRRELAAFGVPPARIDVVEPGTDPVPLRPRARGSALRLLSVGSLTPRKGHDVLFDALALLTDRDWSLRCAGSLERDPATAAALAARIERLGLGPRIALLGELDPAGVAAEYARADLFVLPSHLEGYGMVIAEAVAHGLPVVATAAGAVADTLPAGTGVLVPPGDSAALARALAALLDAPDALAALAHKAAAARDRLPTWGASARRFAAALARVERDRFAGDPR